jgi:glycosyltransferase involved in cell wall biosynthesis
MIVNVCAPNWTQADSYGRLARALSDGLTEQGFYVNRLGGNAPGGLLRPVLGGLLLGYPTLYDHLSPLARVGPRVALTMFESTRLPDEWTPILNTCDAVIVPAHFLLGVLADCGVRVPVFHVPLGIDGERFAYVPRKRRRRFTFLCVGDRGTRKGWPTAAAAFVRAFGDDDRYRLIVKARYNGTDVRLTNPNIKLIQRDMSDAVLARFYGEADCFIDANQGEGFGFLGREFAATGGLSISTAWGGTADDGNEWGIPLGYTLTPAWVGTPHFDGLGEWAEADVDELAARLREVAAWSVERRNEMGKAAADSIRRLYPWTLFASRVASIWRAVLSVRAGLPPPVARGALPGYRGSAPTPVG